jgi:hypothetical protein
MKRLFARLRVLDLFDRLVLIGTASGAAGWWAVWPPLAFLFVSAVALVLAAVVDRRTPPVVEAKS